MNAEIADGKLAVIIFLALIINYKIYGGIIPSLSRGVTLCSYKNNANYIFNNFSYFFLFKYLTNLNSLFI